MVKGGEIFLFEVSNVDIGKLPVSNTNIVPLALTGAEAALKSQQSNCHPTTGKDYELSLVSSVQFEAPPDHYSEPSALFASGITPVMTIFYPYSQSNSSIDASEIHLNCIKIVGSTAGETTDKPSEASGRIRGTVMGITVVLSIMILFA